MCDCSNNIVDLSHLKIYTIMAKYKAIKKVTIYHGANGVIRTASATQEELAYAYEELGATNLIEKLSTTKTKDESKKAAKKEKSGKKSSDSKE
tara:strand:- start:3384 stop:3662 length:279 start_codon:yes stop_codon:yes gene_type:complete